MKIFLIILALSETGIHRAVAAVLQFSGTSPACMAEADIIAYVKAQRQVICGAIRMIEILMPDALGAEQKAAVMAWLLSWGLSSAMATFYTAATFTNQFWIRN